MESSGRLNLRESLHLADSILTTQSMSLALNNRDDGSLRFNLPPLIGSGSNSLTPDSATLKVMATLYFQAELEQAGIIAVAELLAESRYELKVYGEKSARMLEEFFRNKRDWYDRNAREQIYLRVFGFSANNQNANSANRDFQTKFANFCVSLWRLGDSFTYQKKPSPMIESAFKQSAADLLINLGTRRYGDIYEGSKRIQNQLSKSISLLEDEGIGNALQTKGMWNILRNVLSPNVPDFARLTTRGQSGLRLLNWLSSILPQISDVNSTKPILDGISPVVNWAEMWLEASGFDVRQMYARRSA
jgi:hypothetical protein